MPSISLSNDQTLQLRKFFWAINFARCTDAGSFSNNDHYAEMSKYLFRGPGTIENFLLLGNTRTRFQFGAFLAAIAEFKNRPIIEKNTQDEFDRWCEVIQSKFNATEGFSLEEVSQTSDEKQQAILSKLDIKAVIKLFQESKWCIYTKGKRGQFELLFRSTVVFGNLNEDNTIDVQMRHPRSYPAVTDEHNMAMVVINYLAIITSIECDLEINIHELEVSDNLRRIRTLPQFSYQFEGRHLQDTSLSLGSIFYKASNLEIPWYLPSLIMRIHTDTDFTPMEVDLHDDNADDNVAGHFKYGSYTNSQTSYRQPYNLDTLKESTKAAKIYRSMSLPELEGNYILITETNFKDFFLPEVIIVNRPNTSPENYLLTASLRLPHPSSKYLWRGKARPNFKTKLITFILYEQSVDDCYSDFDRQPLILMINLPKRDVHRLTLLSATLVGSKLFEGDMASKLFEGKECSAQLIFLKKINPSMKCQISSEENKALQDFYKKFRYETRVTPPAKTISEFGDLKFL